MREEIINDLAKSLLLLSAIANWIVSKKYLEQCIPVPKCDAGNSSLRCQQINASIIVRLMR